MVVLSMCTHLIREYSSTTKLEHLQQGKKKQQLHATRTLYNVTVQKLTFHSRIKDTPYNHGALAIASRIAMHVHTYV